MSPENRTVKHSGMSSLVSQMGCGTAEVLQHEQNGLLPGSAAHRAGVLGRGQKLQDLCGQVTASPIQNWRVWILPPDK
jgi:hypothetical protein